MSSMKKTIEAIITASTAQGWKHSRTANGHHQFYSPNKHDIVVCADSSDTHALQNFLSQMRRAGYVECEARPATQSLGDQLAAVLATPRQEEVVTDRRVTLPEIVINFLRRQGKPCTTDDIVMVVKHHRPSAQRQSILSELSRLTTSKRLLHIGRGLYGLPVESKVPEETSPPFGAAEIEEERAAVHSDPLLALDEALAALARAGALLSAHRTALLARPA